MQFPTDYKYSKEHTWLQPVDNHLALIGITEFAQGELGEIVYVDLPKVGDKFKKEEVFGSVEAVKTTSDLFMPVGGEVIEVNSALKDNPALVNNESFTSGWMIKIKLLNYTEVDSLLTAEEYKTMVS